MLRKIPTGCGATVDEVVDALNGEIATLRARVAEIEAMIDTFVAAHSWAADTWKRAPCIAPLFADARKRKAVKP